MRLGRIGRNRSIYVLHRKAGMQYPDALDRTLVGTYPALAHVGGGYVWDAVLEYRVWCHPEDGAPMVEEGNDYYYSFATYQEALDFSNGNAGTEEPLALVLQEEYIDEPEAGQYVHVKARRITEWPVNFLSRPRRRPHTIPDFFAADAPPNRLDILRGSASADRKGGKQAGEPTDDVKEGGSSPGAS